MFRPPCDSIIFALDGTLWDASPTSAIAWVKTANELGIKVSIDEGAIKGVSGLPFDKCVDVLFGSHAQTVPNLRALLDESEKKEILALGGQFTSETLTGIKKQLLLLKPSSFLLALDLVQFKWPAIKLNLFMT